MSLSNTKARFNLCGLLCLLPVLPITGRLFYLQTFRHQELSSKASRSFNSRTPEIKLRGRILDSNETVLAESLPTYTCAILKHDNTNRSKTIKALSACLSIPQEEISKKWQASKNFFYVKKNITPDEYENLEKTIETQKLKGDRDTALQGYAGILF